MLFNCNQKSSNGLISVFHCLRSFQDHNVIKLVLMSIMACNYKQHTESKKVFMVLE